MASTARARPIDAVPGRAQFTPMEAYSLFVLFGGMIIVWWFNWAPWRKRDGDYHAHKDEPPQDPPH